MFRTAMRQGFNPFARFQAERVGGDGAGAAPSPAPVPSPSYPVALALGGGAARGFAHIGVLKVLERHGIRPSIVAGTSIGAAVGGMWAAGHLPAFEAWARTLTKRNMLSFIDLALGAPGLIGGRKLMERLRGQLGTQRIETLPVTFSAVATELGTGQEVWLTRGDLAEAIHASYCLPGIFSPACINGRWLMDGTLVNPVPVSCARALGGRLVIAVNLSAEVFSQGTVVHDSGGPLAAAAETLMGQRRTGAGQGETGPGETGQEEAGQEEAAQREMVHSEMGQAEISEPAAGRPAAGPMGFARMLRPDRLLRRQLIARAGNGPRGISEVIIDAFNVTQDRIARSRLAGDPPDFLVSPRLSRIGLFDFHRAAEAIDLGEEAAERMVGDIKLAAAGLR